MKTGTVSNTTVHHSPKAHPLHLGDPVKLSGRVEYRSPVAIGSEAPPSGAYLVLDQPALIEGHQVKSLFLGSATPKKGAHLTLEGRIGQRSYGGLEMPAGSVFTLIQGPKLTRVQDLDLNGVKFVEPDYSKNPMGYQPLQATRWGAGVQALADILALGKPEKLDAEAMSRLLNRSSAVKNEGLEASAFGGTLFINYDPERTSSAEARQIVKPFIAKWPGRAKIEFAPFPTALG